jgi:hypothetical protein
MPLDSYAGVSRKVIIASTHTDKLVDRALSVTQRPRRLRLTHWSMRILTAGLTRSDDRNGPLMSNARRGHRIDHGWQARHGRTSTAIGTPYAAAPPGGTASSVKGTGVGSSRGERSEGIQVKKERYSKPFY